MITRDQILAQSTGLLKDDPGVADAIVNPAPPGSRAARKIKALTASVKRLTPPASSPPLDPFGQLCGALADVLDGRGFKGAALSLVVDLTNRHCPMTKTYHLLRDIRGSISDIGEPRAGLFSDWSPAQATAIGTHPSAAGPGIAHIGYRIAAPRLCHALDELALVTREPAAIDPRHGLVYACYRLVTSTLRQLRGDLDRAGDQWLEFLFDEATPGRFFIRTIDAEDGPVVRAVDAGYAEETPR